MTITVMKRTSRNERNRRRFLLAQLNTDRRLSGRPELQRFHGTTRKLFAAVAKACR